MNFALATSSTDGFDSIQLVGDLYESRASNFALLREIDETCDELKILCKKAEDLARPTYKVAAQIPKWKVIEGSLIDERTSIIESVENGIPIFADKLSELVARKAHVDPDKDLGQAHRDRLKAEFDCAIDALGSVIEAGRMLVEAVIAHDLKAEPKPTAKYSDAASLVAALRS